MSRVESGGNSHRDDALMSAVTGEQPADAIAGTDELAEATAAVNALRRGMAALGTELAAATPAGVADSRTPLIAAPTNHGPDRPPARRMSTRSWVLATAAGVLGVALVGGYALRASDPADTSASRSLPGVVACAETIAVGSVASVSRTGDRFTVTLDSVRYLKPENGPEVLTVGDAELAVGGSSTEPVTGQPALVVVHDAAKGDVDLVTGADIDSEWAWMAQALPDSRSIDSTDCADE
ncbi:hypothetical protein ACIBO1_28595 [Micromonospora sp. NPDC049903]|uniref:hypothetical protein n=1 Tax=Micromonospora sp. NPDC049903 TaxID=3364276 RepID=UPI0037ABAC91